MTSDPLMSHPAVPPPGLVQPPFHVGFFTWYWAAWILAFLIPELWWVFRNSQGTLSWSVWDLESLNLSQPLDFQMWTDVHWIVSSLVWVLFAWLSIHLPFGYLR